MKVIGLAWVRRIASMVRMETYSIFVTVGILLDRKGLNSRAVAAWHDFLRSNGKRSFRFRNTRNNNFPHFLLDRYYFWGLLLPIVAAYAVTKLPFRLPEVSLNILRDNVVTLVAIPLSLVGLLVPFVTISITLVYSKIAGDVVQQFFRRRGVKELIFSALGVLFLQLLVLFLVRTMPSDDTSVTFGFPNSFLYFATWGWSITLIILLAFRLLQILKELSLGTAVKVYRDQFLSEAKDSLSTEIIRNLSWNILEKALKDTQISISFFRPSEGQLVTSNTEGIVSNISLWGLNKVANALDKWAPGSNFKIGVIRPQYSLEKRDMQVASINPPIESPLKRPIHRMLRACFAIERAKDEEDKLFAVMEGYKELVLGTVRSANEAQVKLALEGYSAFFKEYLDLGVRLKAEDQPGYWADWRPLMLINSSLGDVIRISVSQKGVATIGQIAYWLGLQLRMAVEADEEYLFSRILRLFQQMWFYSLESQNEIGLDRAHREPIQIFDYDLFRFGETEEVTLAKANARYRMARLVITHLHGLLKISIDQGDIKRIQELLHILSPKELFAHYHPDLSFDEYEIERKLKVPSLLAAERKGLTEQLEVATLLKRFETEYPQLHSDALHSATAYVLERVDSDSIPIGQAKQLLDVLWPEIGDVHTTLLWLENYNIASVHTGLWENRPDTRTVYSKDPMKMPLLLFTLQALSAQQRSASSISLSASRTINSFISVLQKMAEEIPKSDKWNALVGGLAPTSTTPLLEALSKSKSAFNDQVVREIREAPLDPERIETFKNKARESFNHSAIFLRIIRRSSPSISSEKITIPASRWIREPKEAFIKQDRVSYIDFGSFDGRDFGTGIDNLIYGKIADAVPPQNKISAVSNASEGLDESLRRLRTSGITPNAILLGKRAEVRMSFWDMEKFVPAWRLGKQEGHYYFGEYDGVPVYSLLADSSTLMIVGRLESIELAVVDDLNIEVREFTDEERGKILQQDKSLNSESVKELVSVKLTLKLDLSIRNSEIIYGLVPSVRSE